MTTKTRYFLLGASLVLFVGLSIGVVAYYGGLPQGLFGRSVGPADLDYIPADAAVVAYANVQDVMQSELRQKLRQMAETGDEGRNELKERTGIDIEHDIDSVLACVVKTVTGGDGNGVVLARGRFDTGRLETLAREKGATVETYKGKRLMTMLPGDPDRAKAGHRAELALAFLDPGLIAMGTASMVRGVIDHTGASVRSNEEMMGRIRDLADASVWAVGRFDAISAGARLPADVTNRIPPITWFTASGRVNGGMQASVQVMARDAQGAENLRDIIRGFIALAKMQAGNRPDAQALLPPIQLGGEGNTVAVSFEVSTQLLDAYLQRRGEGRSPKKGGAK